MSWDGKGFEPNPFDEPSITVFGTVERFSLRARLRMAWRVLRGRPMFDAEPLSASTDAAP